MCGLAKLGKGAPAGRRSGCRPDQAKTSPLAGDRRFLGLSVGRNDGQWVEPVQVVLNLTVPTLEAGLVQWMVVNCISSIGREKQVKTSVPSPNFSVLRVNNSLKQGLRSRTMNPLSIGDFGAQ